MLSDNEFSNEEQEEEFVSAEEKAKLQAEVANMTFEELIKLKSELGSKLYGKSLSKEEMRTKPKTSFKRVNKNRPKEMSSKIKPRLTLRTKPEYVKSNKNKLIKIDPRFNEHCGTFSKDQFENNFKFIDSIKKQEREQLEEELKQTKDVAKQKQIKVLLQKMDNQLREMEKRESQKVVKSKENDENKRLMREGKKRIFKSSAAKKIEGLISKFEDLKRTNNLQHHIERRAKKLVNKERKKLHNIKT